MWSAMNSAIRGTMRLATLGTLASVIAAGSVGAQTRVSASVGDSARRVRGWVGVSYIQRAEGDSRSGRVRSALPVLESVEPGSPAERAGLVAGDTIVSFNGVDVRVQPLAVLRSLRPGSTLLVRVKRGAVPKSIAVLVAERPVGVDIGKVSVSFGMESSSPPRLAPRAPVGLPVALPFGVHAQVPVAGAEIAELNQGLARALRVVETGVLVLEAHPGTPAGAAGLRGGDVVTKVDGAVVTGTAALVRALRRASGRNVVLDVLRGGRTERVTLRW